MEVQGISKDQVVKNSFWKFCESIGVQLIQLVVTIILARILSPDDYGLMAIVLVVVNFLGLFVSSSISTYLVYLKETRKQDIFTALIVNSLLAFFLLLVLFLSAGLIADYYNAPPLKPLIRVMSLVLPFNAVSAIYNSYAIKMSLHKKLFLRNLIAIPISGAVALTCAFCGLGVWAMVAQQVVYSVLLAVIIVLTIKITGDGEWKMNPKVIFPMLRYGGFTFLASVIAFIGDNLYDLIIGKRINSEQLGYYNRGNAFPNMISNVLNNVLVGVFFPAFASYNSNFLELKDKYRKTLRLLYYIVLPLFFGLIVCAQPLVVSLLTEKWIPSIRIIQIVCLYFCAIPFLQASSQLSLAVGAVRIRTVGEVFKMVVSIVLLFATVKHGIIAVALGRVGVALAVVLFTVVVNKIIVKYKVREFLSDMIGPFLLSLLMALCIYPMVLLPWNNLLILVMQVLVGAALYLGVARLLKIKELKVVEDLIRSKLAK